jgi:3-oxoacyl-[acyl-carrier protein] reductase
VRSVIVTGGSRGLGLGIAETLAESGFQVIAVARRESRELAAAQERAAKRGSNSLHYRSFDLEDIEGIGDFIRALHHDFGRMYGLVNNAAIGLSGILTNVSDRAISQCVRLNVTSPITLTKYVVRSMMVDSGSGGCIVNVSSIVSTTGYSGLSVYSATKASLIGFTRSLARDVGSLGITVNAIAPGFIETEMTSEMDQSHRNQIARRSALRHLPEVSDVANMVGYLFSERARNITGTVITVDAGSTA